MYKFQKVPLTGAGTGYFVDRGGLMSQRVRDLFFHIKLENQQGSLWVDQWAGNSCAAMMLSGLTFCPWPVESVPDFLKFLETLDHRGGYVPRRFYFIVKENAESIPSFVRRLITDGHAKQLDSFKNKAHGSHGNLGMFVIEV